jgi:1-acyl-sn-glycerol-3-phosphate acyltransferase
VRPDLLLYQAVRLVFVAFCRVYWRMSVEGREHIPTDEPFVLAPVHRSNVDFAVASTLTPRRMRYMGKDSLWKIKALGALWNALGAYPVHRGTADREALRRTIEVIEGGEPVVIFPEGTRQEGPIVQPLFEGAAYVATRAGVPIVPVGIGGTQKAMPRGSKMLRPVKVHVVIGPVLRPKPVEAGKRASRSSIHELTQQLHTELQALFDRAQARA